MHSGRHFSLPIDPWPQASLAERTAVGVVLTLLLLLPACAVGATLFVISMVATYIAWSYESGVCLREVIGRRAGGFVGRHRRIVRKI
ncbi:MULTISPECIES: hypothetical protein [unclassified Methylobacterium]|jgi:hypothetical protein|uniref:hypothetical protein n=1 Tax=unclassified Methylobacterium TaxID=2615210 RepID=UPI001354CBAD|nr:hypothetical protein [Methylobacterium sp. 2A]MWV26075.1 hypothetical protein [Methylobacterium sp. 2A]